MGQGSVEKSKVGGSPRCSGVGMSDGPTRDGPRDGLVATSPLDVFRATPMQRVQLLKAKCAGRCDYPGRPADPSDSVQVDQCLARSRASKSSERRSSLPPEAERVLGVAKLVGQVQQMVEESGNPEGFSASHWISGWLVEPLPALGGERPIELLGTMEGQEVIAGLLTQIEGGVYA